MFVAVLDKALPGSRDVNPCFGCVRQSGGSERSGAVSSSTCVRLQTLQDELEKRPTSLHAFSLLLFSPEKQANTEIETSLVWQITACIQTVFHSFPLSQHVLCIAWEEDASLKKYIYISKKMPHLSRSGVKM